MTSKLYQKKKVLIYCILKSNAPKLYSNIRFLSCYQRLMLGQFGYFFVSFLSAVSWIENVDETKLQSNGEEFPTTTTTTNNSTTKPTPIDQKNETANNQNNSVQNRNFQEQDKLLQELIKKPPEQLNIEEIRQLQKLMSGLLRKYHKMKHSLNLQKQPTLPQLSTEKQLDVKH